MVPLPIRLFLLVLFGGGALPCVAQQPQATADTTQAAFRLREARMLHRGVATRAPGEADTTFLNRVFPASFPPAEDLVSYAWHPSAFGRQLFFSSPVPNEYGNSTILYVLDPFRANTYSVQALSLSDLGDETELSALFFVDVDQDGQKELLTLQQGSNSETRQGPDGVWQRAHYQRYLTLIFKFVGRNEAGWPRYQLDETPRPYLDELPTAAEVRQELARHPLRHQRLGKK